MRYASCCRWQFRLDFDQLNELQIAVKQEMIENKDTKFGKCCFYIFRSTIGDQPQRITIWLASRVAVCMALADAVVTPFSP